VAAWRARVAGSGLGLDVDLARLAGARRPPTATRLASPATPSVACFCLPGIRGIAIVVARL